MAAWLQSNSIGPLDKANAGESGPMWEDIRLALLWSGQKRADAQVAIHRRSRRKHEVFTSGGAISGMPVSS
jgi:hypothetical protein